MKIHSAKTLKRKTGKKKSRGRRRKKEKKDERKKNLHSKPSSLPYEIEQIIVFFPQLQFLSL